jgi:hypothetical protein
MVAWPTGDGRHSTWHGKTSRHLGVLPALGGGGFGKARASPDVEAAVRRARRTGASTTSRSSATRCGVA